MAARAAGLIVPALLLALLSGCVQDDGKRFNPLRGLTSTSEDEERELGLAFDRELRNHVTVIEDPVVAGFINDLGQAIVSQIEPQPFVYRFRIIQDPSLNAFAVPGGYVYFHSGTVMAAGSIDELAGVMGHEIAHVKAHHYARMKAKTQIPDLLVGLAGMAATVATGEPALLAATQAANVAVKLRFSREFENEADRLGSIFMTRAGYEPAGITRFFERLVDEKKRHPEAIPPYLYSHPDVEERISSVRIQAEELAPTRAPDPTLAAALPEVQGRLAWLLEKGRQSVPPPEPPDDPHHLDPYLSHADDLVQEGQIDEAFLTLSRAEAAEPRDPRAPYQIATLLASQGRHREAIPAYRRAVRLDPTRALVFYKLGLSYEAVGERHLAVYAFEQASRRAGETSNLHEHAEWQIETLIFPVLLEPGFKVAPDDHPGTTRTDYFPAGTRRIAWQARLSSRYDHYLDKLRVRWIDPRGRAVAESRVKRQGRPWVGAELALSGEAPDGQWTAEARYADDVLERSSFRLERAGAQSPAR